MSYTSRRRKPSRLEKLFPEVRYFEAEASKTVGDKVAERVIQEKNSLFRTIFHIAFVFFVGFANFYYILDYINASKPQFLCQIYNTHYINTEYFSEKHLERFERQCNPNYKEKISKDSRDFKDSTEK